MAESASGNLSTTLSAFKTLISVGTAFQSWVGAANAAAALASIYVHSTPTRTRPCVLLRWKQGRYRELEGWSGIIEAIFEAATGSTYQQAGNEASDHTSAAYEFTNDIGPIIEEICANQQAGGYPHIDRDTGVVFKANISRGDLQGDDFHQWMVDFPWGLQ